MFRNIKRASFRHKNSKIFYYFKNYLRQCIPSVVPQKRLARKLSYIDSVDEEYIWKRVNYYNRLEKIVALLPEVKPLSEFKLKNHKRKVYFFDLYEYSRYFPLNFKVQPLFGDVVHVPDIPSVTKSRPIYGDNANSVLLKMNKIRHFLFLRDKYSFEKKKNMLVGRSKAQQEHRVRFLDMYFKHPMCNVGQVNDNMNPHYIVNRLTIEQHLQYKFILCIEGYDVASNLKWVMSSNSIAVMPKPKYETWFMEGTLIPDYHYILIKDDYSDLEERLNYYIEHADEALQIIRHAHEYVDQFRDKRQEDLISLLVLKKYFEKTGQM